jgi:hypothetical protein
MQRHYPARKLNNGNVEVRTWWGLWELPKDGEVDEDVIEAFTTGHCHSFALAMHEKTGWDMYACSYDPGYDTPAHVFIRHPKGKFVDITGFIPKGSRWFRDGVVRVSKEDIYEFFDYLRPQPKLAAPFVKSVLKQIGYKPQIKKAA